MRQRLLSLWRWPWPLCLHLGRCLPTVILIRHAEVVDDPPDPSLSAAGSARSDELRHVLRDASVDAIYVSSYQRTQMTAAPVAQELGLTPIQLGTPADVAAAIRARPAGSTCLVVGHTNTVPETIAALSGITSVVIAPTEFDRLFVLARRRLTQLRYGA